LDNLFPHEDFEGLEGFTTIMNEPLLSDNETQGSARDAANVLAELSASNAQEFSNGP
jgi:hypothetical protein